MVPQETDRALGRVLGDDLRTATFRLVAGALAAAALVALVVRLL